MDEGFFKMTLIFLGAAIIMVPLVRKLGLSSVIGYILGGIIIGPFVLKLIHNADDVMHASEFGVVMLLFIVGLEMEPAKFWAMRKSILGLGTCQMMGTIGVLYFVFHLCGWDQRDALVISICFAMSSTAIVLQTLKEKNLFNSVSGKSSFSILLFQDIAVIPILAFFPWLASSGADHTNKSSMLINSLPDWLKPFSVIFGVGILILLGRFLFVPFLRYVSKSGMSELLTATSLFLVVGASELMIIVGISPALGAFLAGVMLANSEFRHELESNIDPFKGLLLAIFFVSVGAGINFEVIKDGALFISTTVICVLILKFLILFLTGKLFRMSNDQNFLLSFGLSQVGEFAFVLIAFASKLYLIDSELNSQMMAVVAITMCTTPFLLILNERFIAPNFNVKMKEDGKNLEEQMVQRKIIIVGFGHFGSTVGRLLKANGYKATVLDHDSDRVNILRSHGFKVYYGDATRLEILRAAGAENANILVLCLDNPENNKIVLNTAKKYFPHLKIFVRAKNKLDAFDFINSGVENIYRETLGTAVEMGIDILQSAGMRRYSARRIGKRFEMIDKYFTKRLAKEGPDKTSAFTMKESIEIEQKLLANDNIYFNEDISEDSPEISLVPTSPEISDQRI